MSKFQRRSEAQALLKVTTCAMMIALSVVFCRVLGFPTSGMYRVEIGFLPIAIIAILYGPLWSALTCGFDRSDDLYGCEPLDPFVQDRIRIFDGNCIPKKRKDRTCPKYSFLCARRFRRGYSDDDADLRLYVRLYVGRCLDLATCRILGQYARPHYPDGFGG